MLGRRYLSAIGVLTLALSVGAPLQAEHVPTSPTGGLEVEGFARLFLEAGDFDLFGEALGRWGTDSAVDLPYRSLTLGSYYRVHENVKVGAFYRMQASALHDDDWIALGGGEWAWRDVGSRYEHELMLDLSPRLLLDFLPGESWVFMLKNRYMVNFTVGHQSVMTRPTLTYFFLRERQPLFNISAAYALYFPLNFSDALLYQHWPYLELLYHFSPEIKLDLRLSRRVVTWTDSADFQEAHPEADYSHSYTPLSLGVGAIFMLEP